MLLKFSRSRFLLIRNHFKIADYLAIAFILSVLALVGNSSAKLYQRIVMPIDFSHLIPAQDLPVAASSDGLPFKVQDTTSFGGGHWSDNNHMIAEAKRPEDFITFQIPARAGQAYDLYVYLTESYDFGVVKFRLNGASIGNSIDLWSDIILSTGKLYLGRFVANDNKNLLEMKVIGKNPASRTPYYQFAIDGIQLDEVNR